MLMILCLSVLNYIGFSQNSGNSIVSFFIYLIQFNKFFFIVVLYPIHAKLYQAFFKAASLDLYFI